MNISFDDYETVIGFECHVQLMTNSKLFSSGKNSFGHPCNSIVDVVDAGLPGVLPVLNKKTVDFAIKLGLALGCSIRRESVFSRKHYFYPDLPKGYQISQFDKPICENGHLFFRANNEIKSIRIRRIHIEEDAGKNIHEEGSNYSYVDFNRAGTPLLEVVTEPDLHTPSDAMAALKALRQIVTFLDICDGNMQEGSLRADVNISVRKKGDINLGVRTETKNLNSFKFLGQTIMFESRRQIIEIASGKKIIQETRLWDTNIKESRAMRSKEDANDYRYFPDPDLLPLIISDEQIDSIKKDLEELPLDKFKRYTDILKLPSYDAEMLSSDKNLAEYFEKAIKNSSNIKSIANWIINDLLSSVNEEHNQDEETSFHTNIPPEAITSIVNMIDKGEISSNIAKKIFAIIKDHPHKDPKDIVIEHNWKMIGDDLAIKALVTKIIKENPEEVAKYLSGKPKLLAFLMGKIMKESQGKVDAQKAQDILVHELSLLKSAS